jgi:L-asparaginase
VKLLILYTGGTIGMVAQRDGSLVPFHADALRANVPDLARLQAEVECRSLGQPKDSSDMGPEDWVAMADALWAARDEFDGFVVLHGTDTMAYSASALSFMLGGTFGKPVVLTGSQVPLGVLRSDGRDNLLTSLEIAMLQGDHGGPLLREVAVFFENRLFRGNRVYKHSALQFDAFHSPNYPELGRSGVELVLHRKRLWTPDPSQAGRRELNPNVAVATLSPGMSEKALRAMLLDSEAEGVIIQTLGSGNAPAWPWLAGLLREAHEAGVCLAHVSQCRAAAPVASNYASGKVIQDAGVWESGGMILEAAVVKMMLVLALPSAERKAAWTASWAGERD